MSWCPDTPIFDQWVSKMHHKAFGGRAPPEPAGELTALLDSLAEFNRWAPEGERRQRERKGDGRERTPHGGKQIAAIDSIKS